MYLRNYLRQFLRDVRAQKLRLFLTVFGLVWGTAAVTLMLAFGEGLHRQVLVAQKGLGDAIVIAWPSRTSKPWQGLPRGRRIQLTDEDVTLLRTEVEGIRNISEEYAQDGARITYGKKALSVDVSGSNVEFGAMRSMNPQVGGRFLNQLDLDERRRVVFVGDQLAVDLFGAGVDPVGEQVRIDGSPFTVIGVMVKKEQDSSYSGRDKDKAMIPVRGQTEWLIPQPEVNYGFTYRNVECRSKSDGVMVIAIGPGQFAKSWRNSNETPDRAEAEGAVRVVEELMSRFPVRPA